VDRIGLESRHPGLASTSFLMVHSFAPRVNEDIYFIDLEIFYNSLPVGTMVLYSYGSRAGADFLHGKMALAYHRAYSLPVAEGYW